VPSNQVVIVTLAILAGLYSSRVAATVIRIREDQYKVVETDKGIANCSYKNTETAHAVKN